MLVTIAPHYWFFLRTFACLLHFLQLLLTMQYAVTSGRVTQCSSRVMSCYVMSCHVLVTLAYGGFICSARLLMVSSDSEDGSSLASDLESLEDTPVDSWDARPSVPINEYPVSLRHEQEVTSQVKSSQDGRLAAFQHRHEEFLAEYEFS